MQYNEFYTSLFKEICNENNFKFNALSDNYIFCIDKKEKKRTFALGNSLDLNNNVAQKICMDKTALSIVLRENNIPCVNNVLLKNPKVYKNFDRKTIKEFLKQNGTIVIKDNEGSSGKLVFKTKSFLKANFFVKKIHRQNKDACISKYEDVRAEYRLIMLDGNCEIMYKKEKPFVVGDGKTSFYKLFKNKYKDINIKKKIFNSLYIPRKNKKIYLSWLNNLAYNNFPVDIEEKNIINDLKGLAIKCVRLLNLRFCSIDIILTGGEYKVLEINSIVSTKIYASQSDINMKKVKSLYLKAIKKCFEGERQ